LAPNVDPIDELMRIVGPQELEPRQDKAPTFPRRRKGR
jgi:hypothetical protein